MTKIDYCMRIVNEQILNMVSAKIPPKEIAKELLPTARTELTLYDVVPEMQLVFIKNLADIAWFVKYGEHYETI